MKRAWCIVVALVLASLIFKSAPPLLDLARRSLALRRLSYKARREQVNGPLYTSAMLVQSLLPKGEPVALVSAGDNDSYAIFGTYYLYPRPSRQYREFDIYRLAAADPRRPKTIVLAADKLTIVTYEEVRDARLRRNRVVHAAPSGAPRSDFIIPLAASGDGVPPNTWVNEADFANDTSARATVTMWLYPQMRRKTISIAPHETASYYDFVYQTYRHMDTGWVHISSTQPLRSSVWYVDRGRETVSPIPLIDVTPRAGTLRCPASECKAWVFNLDDRDEQPRINGEAVPLKPRDMTWRAFSGEAIVEGANVFAFATTKQPPTRFVWPEGVKP
jgi:hypothetical protein